MLMIPESRLTELLNSVESQWRNGLELFLRNNEMTSEFEAHLDGCPICQAAVNEVLDAEEHALMAVGLIAQHKDEKGAPVVKQPAPVLPPARPADALVAAAVAPTPRSGAVRLA
jgi:hypothetical protein